MSARLFKNFYLLLMGINVLYFMVNTASSLKPNADIIDTVNEEISQLRDYKKDYDSKHVQNIEVKASQFIINEKTKLRDKLHARDSFEYIYNGIMLKGKLDEVKMNCFLKYKDTSNPDDMKICLKNDGILVAGGYLKEVRSLSLEGYAESQAYKCIEEPIIRYRTDKTLVASAQACEKNRVG